MITNKTSEEFKRKFLKEFTKELIRNYGNDSIIELKTILKKEYDDKIKREKQEKDKIKRLVLNIEKKQEEIKKKEHITKENINEIKRELLQRDNTPIKEKREFSKKRTLRIPELRLPEHLSYLRPTPSNEKYIELVKIDSLIKDFNVRTLECLGVDKPIIVSGRMGVKTTNISLSEEDINSIINKFSSESMIPLEEGIFRAVVGRLEISAIISHSTENKFMINKIEKYSSNRLLSQ
jgi:hypothetical protein